MALESSTYISGLVVSNPTSTDNVGDGDNHIRLLKSTIKATFPNISGAVTPTHTAINSGVAAANAATNANTASTIVKRDASGNFTAGTITAALSGNASTASRWATARAITLTGDVTGTANIRGDADASIFATVTNNSHDHTIANVTGLQTALDDKVDDSQVLTNVPANALFTDTNTTYSEGDGGLTQKNFTTTLKNKLDGIEANATADQTAAQILTAIKTVDGSGSGLDADKIDGKHISTSQTGTDSNTIYFRT